MPTVQILITPLPAHVRTARLIAAVLARRAGVDETLIDEVKLAVGEACSRAVGLHHAAHGADDVTVELSDDDKKFVVVVRDCGPAEADTAIAATGEPVADLPALVDVEDLAEGDPGEPMPAGFGLAVIAGLVDDLDVTTEHDGTAVRMSWTV